jgi:uncharacterized protein (TIGR03435 family)
MRTLALALMLGVSPPSAVFAQASQPRGAPKPTFEVASIKPTKECGGRGGTKTGGPPGGGGRGVSESPGRIEWDCATVAGLIKEAYGRYANGRVASIVYNPPPLQGGPAWINSDTYSIMAKAENAVSMGMMNGPMLQALLEDRFKLKVHRGIKQAQVYVLAAAKAGPKLKPFQQGSCTPLDPERPLGPPQPGKPRGCNMMIRGVPEKGSNIVAIDMGSATLDDLSTGLARVVGRPVIDKTGIHGMFTIYVEFAVDEGTPGLVPPPDAPRPPVSDEPAAGSSIFTALQEQLGLKLTPSKGPTEVLVIDRVERPSEN